ncbi:hypothetical protein JTB14_033578 [Gonioctena quinquepunctata]|nr:hypothetical protein JTB14_033578 [Gonioctena quinquepunctata]
MMRSLKVLDAMVTSMWKELCRLTCRSMWRDRFIRNVQKIRGSLECPGAQSPRSSIVPYKLLLGVNWNICNIHRACSLQLLCPLLHRNQFQATRLRSAVDCARFYISSTIFKIVTGFRLPHESLIISLGERSCPRKMLKLLRN